MRVWKRRLRSWKRRYPPALPQTLWSTKATSIFDLGPCLQYMQTQMQGVFCLQVHPDMDLLGLYEGSSFAQDWHYILGLSPIDGQTTVSMYWYQGWLQWQTHHAILAPSCPMLLPPLYGRLLTCTDTSDATSHLDHFEPRLSCLQICRAKLRRSTMSSPVGWDKLPTCISRKKKDGPFTTLQSWNCV